MQQETTISVIVPNYNHGAYLEERLESVLAQTYAHFEVIILDDCSTDNSREVIERYRSHPRVTQVIYNEANSGSTFKQWRKGIACAAGAYIWIAESDDWCMPQFLETLVLALDQHPTAVFAFCQTHCVNAQGKPLWETFHKGAPQLVNGLDFIRHSMVLKNAVVNASMVIFKKTAFESVSLAFLEYKYCGDWLFWIELCRAGDVYVSEQKLNFFRKHDNDVTGKSLAQGIDIIEHLSILDRLRCYNIISNHEFHVALIDRYRKFANESGQYGVDEAEEVMKAFYRYAGTGLRFKLLKFTYNIRKWLVQQKVRLHAAF